jgi:hypothetical protein
MDFDKIMPNNDPYKGMYGDDIEFCKKLRSFSLPSEATCKEEALELIKSELKDITADEINEQKRMIDLYKQHIDNHKKHGENPEILETIHTHWVKAIYILCNMEVKRDRQIKVKALLDKLVIPDIIE